MRKQILAFLLVASCGGSKASTTTPPDPVDPPIDPTPVEPEPVQVAPPTVQEAQAFVARVDADLRALWTAQSIAEWENSTNITDETDKKAAEAGAKVSSYLTKTIRESRRFDPIVDQVDPDTRRQLMLLRIAGMPAPEDQAKAEDLANVTTAMESLYGKGKYCDAAGKCKDLGELSDILSESRDPAALADAWKGWHAIARDIKPFYAKFVTLANEGARTAGFKDVGEMWRSGYDMPAADFEVEMDRLWNQVKPLYAQLHCYARRQLVKKYGKDVVGETGPIPAHLLGNMWSQAWSNVYDLMEPFKGQPSPDVSKEMVKQKWDWKRMVELAESFFVSLGLDALPATFWERSMFVKPEGREVVCHASAWDVHFNDDLRIKMCIKVNQEDLITIHHELGHNYYYHYYYKLPMLYQNGAHDGFHEAIGDAIALSVTPTYLKKVGLLKKMPSGNKGVINQQMFVALDKIAFLPFGYLMDRWRWDVFRGDVTPDKYNAHWWKLRTEIQGIAPPEPRTEADFDPGAKYHIPANTPYARYFLSTVLQFQFHKAMCTAAGFKGPLHECSVHGSKEAGAKLQAMLALGASKPWPEALEAMTGTPKMDAGALLEYFDPLRKWLEEQNKGQACGW
jgi:peptidyl-dipeptidase A